MSDASPTIEQLRTAFADRPLSGPPAGSTQEVDATEIWDAVNGDADPARVDELAQAMARDPVLALEWRIAVELKAAMELEGRADAPVLPSRRASASPRAFALVAAVAAGLLVAILLGRRDSQSPFEEPAYRGDPAAATWQGEVVPGERTLTWAPVPGARAYRVRVFDPRLTPVHESAELSEPRYELPDDLSGQLRWQVQADMGDGTSQRSPTFSVDLAPAR